MKIVRIIIAVIFGLVMVGVAAWLCILACGPEPVLIIPIVVLALLFYWVGLMLLYCRKRYFYYVDDYAIEVFTGYVRHYVIVNGDKVDEIKTLTFLNLVLTALREKLNVQVRIGHGFLGNTISTKINGKIVEGSTKPRS